jgi:hypothetical protein
MEERNFDNVIAHGHEPPTTSLRAVWWSAFALAILSVGTFFLIWGLMVLLADVPRPPTEEAMFRAESQRLPAGAPPLDVNLSAELKRTRAEQREFLDSLQWVDQQAGIARIPIAEAMAIVAKNGLPKSFPAQTAATEENTSHD